MIMFLRTLTEAGITPETQREDALEIRATNMMTTYLSLLVYPLVVFSYVQFPDKTYWIQLFFLASLYGLSPIFNHFKLHTLARTFSVYTGLLAVSWGTWLFGFDTGIQFLFFVNVVNAFMSFHFSHRWKVATIIISIFLVYLLSWYNYEMFGAEVPLNYHQKQTWSAFFWILGFVAILIYSYFSLQVVRTKSRDLMQHQSKLENQNIALSKANKELDYFFYAISHDLRSPLASVLGLIELMKMEDDPKQINTYLNLQEASIHKMNDFIFDIIHIAKNARQNIESKPIHFQQLIGDIFLQHEFNEDSQKIEKIIQIHDENPFHSDPTRLKIVLNNLLSNAIHYSNTTKDNPQIKIEIQTSPKNAKIIVWDNGLGIPEEYQKKVFDMFFRGTDAKAGTGLGLYMVHEIVTKLGGQISLKSEVGSYTEFSIILPQIN